MNSTIRQFDNGKMEKWKSGKMKNGMLERFYHGDTEITELEEWKSGRMDEFDNSTMENGKMDDSN